MNQKHEELIDKIDRLFSIQRKNPGVVDNLLKHLLESLNYETSFALDNANHLLGLYILNRVGEELSKATTGGINQILELIFEQTSLLMNTKNFYVALYEKDKDEVSFPLVYESGEQKKPIGDWASRHAGRGMTEYVLRHQKPLLISKDVDGWKKKHSRDVVPIGLASMSWLGVPMIVKDQVIGVITLQDYENPNTYDQNDCTVLTTIASQAAIAIDNARLFDETRRLYKQAQDRLEELRHLREVGQAITAIVRLEEVLRAVVEGAKDVMHADVVALYPIDNGNFSPPIMAGEMYFSHKHDAMPTKGGIASQVLSKDDLLVAENPIDDPNLRSSFVTQENIQSFAGIALRVGGVLIKGGVVGGQAEGVLYINYRHRHTFTEDEENTIHLFANQAAIAIYNARLYKQAQDRALEIQHLAKVSQRILKYSSNTRQVLRKIVDQARQVSQADLVILYIYNQRHHNFELPTIQSGELLDKNFPVHKKVLDDDIANQIVCNKKPTFASNSQEFIQSPLINQARNSPSFINREKIVSSAGIPLIVSNETVGVMFVNYRSPQIFDQHQRTIIEIFASSAAIAMHNTRLQNKIRSDLNRRINEFEALVNIDQTLTSNDLDSVLLRIVKAAVEIVGAKNVSLLLVDESGEYIELRAQYGQKWSKSIQQKFRIGEHGISGYVAENKQPILIADVLSPPWDRIYIPSLPNMRSELVVPMIDQNERVIGLINLESKEVNAFTKEDLNLMVALAKKGVIAIQNFERYTSIERARADMEIIDNIDDAVSSSLDLQTVLNMILEKGMTLIKTSVGNIMMFDKNHNDLWMAAEVGVAEEYKKSRQKLGEGIVGKVALEKKSLLVQDVRAPEWEGNFLPFIPDTRSELAVPMLREGELIGVINFESPKVNYFKKRDQQLSETLARHVVIAVNNAEKYKQLEVLRNIDQKIITVQEEKQILSVILNNALDLIGADLGEIRLLDDSNELLHIEVSDNRVGVPIESHLRSIPLGIGIIGKVVESRESRIIHDTLNLDEKIDFYFKGIRSALIVPLIIENGIKGVICLESLRPDIFDDADKDMLITLAGTTIIALQDIKRLRDALSGQERLHAMHQIDQATILELGDPYPVIQVILENIIRLTGANIGQLHIFDNNHQPDIYSMRLDQQQNLMPIEKLYNEEIVNFPSARKIVEIVSKTKKIEVADFKPTEDLYLIRGPIIQKEVGVPLLTDEQKLIGVLYTSQNASDFRSDHLEILTMVAGQAVIAIQKAQNYTKAQVESQRFELLNQTGLELGKLSDYDCIQDAYDMVLKNAILHTHSHQAVIRRYDPINQSLVCARFLPLDVTPPFEKMNLDEGLSGYVSRTRKTKYIPDIRNPPPGLPVKPSDSDVLSMVITPIKFESHYYGNLGLSYKNIGHFQKNDIEFLEGLAYQLAITIHRFENIIAQKEAEKRVNSAEVMASIGQSAFELAHRLSNDLGLVKKKYNRIHQELLQLGINSPVIKVNLEEILTAVRKVLDLSDDLQQGFGFLTLEQPNPERSNIPIQMLYEEMIESVPERPPGVTLISEGIDETMQVLANHKQIADILRNLFTNSIEAIGKSGTIIFTARNVGEFIEISLQDSGPGIPPKSRKEIFDLFYSSKGTSGFGLWSARLNALRNHGDLVLVDDPQWKGAIFRLTLPAS